MTHDLPQSAHRDDDRSAEIARAISALRDGIGVFVVGERGSGRRDFVRAVLDGLATAARSRLWIGHDLELVGPEQASRLAEAVTARTMVPLATVSARRHLDPGIEALVRKGLVVRIAPGPLSSTALLRRAEERLGGPLETDTASAFVPPRGGADLSAFDEALTLARNAGVLRRTEAGWALRAPMPPSEPLRTLLRSRAEGSEAGEVAESVLDVVALAPGLSLAAAIRISDRLNPDGDPESGLERLEEAGVLEIIETAGDARLRVRDGIVELLLPQCIGVLRRRRLTAAIVDVLGEVPALELGVGELVAFAGLSLTLGRPVDKRILVMAATTSLRSSDSLASLRLAGAAVESGGGFEAELAFAAAEAQAGRSESARERLHRLVTEAEGDSQLSGALSALTGHVLVSTADHAALRELESSATRVLREPSAKSNVLKGLMLFSIGDAIGAAELVEPNLVDLSGEDYGEACFVLASAAFLAGRLSRAETMLDRSERALAAAGVDASKVQVVRANLRFFQGRGAESLQTMAAFREGAAAAGMRAAQAVCGWAIGTALLAQGRVVEARGELAACVEVMDQVGLTGMARGVRSDLATALALTGDEDHAVRELASSAAAPPGNGAAGKILQAQGWIDAAAGRRGDASVVFVRSADAYAAQGLYLARLSALMDAARAGAASTVLEQVEALSGVVEGAYAALGLRLVRALAWAEAEGWRSRSSGSPRTADGGRSELRAIAAEFDAVGEDAVAIRTHMIAAEVFSRAGALHDLDGASRESAASARRRDEQVALCGVQNLPFVRADRLTPLSGREVELARLASSGLSNREIAEHLTLSVRTVETHLQRVYRKLGIRGRTELTPSGD